MSGRKRRPILRGWGDPISRGLILVNKHGCELNKKAAKNQACIWRKIGRGG
jgi:hypothetical protein